MDYRGVKCEGTGIFCIQLLQVGFNSGCSEHDIEPSDFIEAQNDFTN